MWGCERSTARKVLCSRCSLWSGRPLETHSWVAISCSSRCTVDRAPILYARKHWCIVCGRPLVMNFRPNQCHMYLASGRPLARYFCGYSIPDVSRAVDRSRGPFVRVLLEMQHEQSTVHCYLVALSGQFITTYSSRAVDRSGGTFVHVPHKMLCKRSTTRNRL